MIRRLPISLLNILKIILIGICVIYLLWGIDFVRLIGSVKTMIPTGLILVFVFIIFDFLAMGARTRFIAKHKVPYKTAFNAALIGFGINNLIPAKAGEIVKALYLKWEEKIQFKTGIGIIFWERFADLNMLLLCMCLAVAFNELGLIIWLILSGSILLWMSLFAFKLFPHSTVHLISFIPFQGIQKFIIQLIEQLRNRMTLTFFIGLLFFTLMIWFFYYLQYYFLLKKAALLDLSLWQIFFVFVVAVSGMAIPSTPGAVGIYELFIVSGLTMFDVNKETALAIGLVYHIMLSVPPTIYAILILFQKGLLPELYARLISKELN